jgi:hypothetical protein
MLNNKREIEINGKHYTLTINRSLIYKIGIIIPEVLKIADKSNEQGDINETELTDEEKLESLDSKIIDELYDKMNLIFYEMLKFKHQDITLEKSNEIYSNFHKEYNNVDENLMSLIMKVFTQGVPRNEKKEINW